MKIETFLVISLMVFLVNMGCRMEYSSGHTNEDRSLELVDRPRPTAEPTPLKKDHNYTVYTFGTNRYGQTQVNKIYEASEADMTYGGWRLKTLDGEYIRMTGNVIVRGTE